MIVTVTPSPAIDWTIHLTDFRFGGVNRMDSSGKEPSGKGVNIALALHRAGIETCCVLPAGGSTGAYMAGCFSQIGVPHLIVDTGEDVRTNITLVTESDTTKINAPGTHLSPERLAAFSEAIDSAAENASAVVLAGSLPLGVAPGFVRDTAARLKASGVRVAIDTSGTALELALEARPDLVKPNLLELSELVHRPLRTIGDVVEAAHEARARGALAVLASLGPDGALFVDDDDVLLATSRDIPVINSVGAGDALLAGFISTGSSTVQRLATASLWAASAVAHPTTLFPVIESFADQISVGPVSPGSSMDQPLSAPAELPRKPAPTSPEAS
ncbi:MAG TPA: 1-phosphofructokinase family hexose kinase [Actinomycetaceae bacterium]|nr:1-phosphofructokinase family hexose kinase [Actinomycetaceae bacterium]